MGASKDFATVTCEHVNDLPELINHQNHDIDRHCFHALPGFFTPTYCQSIQGVFSAKRMKSLKSDEGMWRALTMTGVQNTQKMS